MVLKHQHPVVTLAASVRLSVCPVGILTVTHQGQTSVHFGQTIRRTDLLVIVSVAAR